MVARSSPGQIHFRFYHSHLTALEREREARRRAKMLHAQQLRRERRGTLRHLLELSDLPESHLSKSELELLDQYVIGERDKIKFAWSPLEEADRKGVDIRKASALFQSCGIVHQCGLVMHAQGFELEVDDEWN